MITQKPSFNFMKTHYEVIQGVRYLCYGHCVANYNYINRKLIDVFNVSAVGRLGGSSERHDSAIEENVWHFQNNHVYFLNYSPNRIHITCKRLFPRTISYFRCNLWMILHVLFFFQQWIVCRD